MNRFHDIFDWIASEQDTMVGLLERWAAINSGSDHIEGLDKMRAALVEAFAPLDAEMEEIALPPKTHLDAHGNIIEHPVGKALRIRRQRPHATMRLFLGGHMDTVYSKDSAFQKTQRLEGGRLHGPGVADMKGGLVVMLTALRAIERHPLAEKISWEVVINADEEIGSVSSERLFVEAAGRNDIGLLFEPSFEDGTIVSARKGSFNFTVVSRGKGAHAGRDFHNGRNAIVPLARFIVAIDALNKPNQGLTINFGRIEGGVATNIVPDLAICRCNARMVDMEELKFLKEQIEQVITNENSAGAELVMRFESARLPKVFDAKQEELFNQLREVGEGLGIRLSWKPSGGVCDGNILVAEGLPTIDTLGAVGGKIHTTEEYIRIDSLTERAQLVTGLILERAGKGR